MFGSIINLHPAPPALPFGPNTLLAGVGGAVETSL